MNTRHTILSHRTRLGWTNYRLAKESGVPESTVRRYLAGQIDTTTEKADRMMGALTPPPNHVESGGRKDHHA